MIYRYWVEPQKMDLGCIPLGHEIVASGVEN